MKHIVDRLKLFIVYKLTIVIQISIIYIINAEVNDFMKALIRKLIVNDFVTFKDNKICKKTYSLFPYNAFTLAEILITLGIIGIVAALTIPTLISNYQKQATVSGLQKAYSTLNQVIQRSIADNGAIENWDFPTTQFDGNQCLLFAQTYFVPYLNISQSCGLSSGCLASTVKRLDGANSVLNNISPGYGLIRYTLSDGTNIAFMNISYSNGQRAISIFVDINGQKTPNVVGKDIFSFVFAQSAISIIGAGDGTIVSNIPRGGIYPDGYGMNIVTSGSYQYRGCGKDVNYQYAGAWCTQKIFKDNWQIASDYPWD